MRQSKKIAFIWSGGTVIVDSKGSHYSRSYTESYCKRFFSVADKAVFFTRMTKSDNINGLTKMDSMNIEYHECINPMSISGFLELNNNYSELEKILLKCDMAVITVPSLFIAKRAQNICNRSKIPYLIQIGGCAWDTMWNHGFIGKLLALPTFLSTRNCIKKAPAVVYVTKGFLQKRYPTNGMSIGCSNVELDLPSNEVLKNRLDKIDNLRDKIIIGTTAAVDVKYKGQQYLIKAINKLRDDKTHYYYQIVGGGNQDYLRTIIKKYGLQERVQLLGSMKHEEVFRWLDRIDIYAQPSRTEGLPRAMIEAMSRGLPCIGANSGGIPELISDELIFSKDSSEIDHICRILKNLNKKMMKDCAVKNFNIAKEYTSDILRNRRTEFYRRVMNNSNKEK